MASNAGSRGGWVWMANKVWKLRKERGMGMNGQRGPVIQEGEGDRYEWPVKSNNAGMRREWVWMTSEVQ